MLLSRGFLFVLATVLPASVSLSQVAPLDTRAFSLQKDIRPDAVEYTTIQPDGSVETYLDDPHEMLDIIVRFTEEPLYRQWMAVGKAGSISSATMQNRFSEFESDIVDLIRNVPAASKMSSVHLRKTYHRVFYGASLSVPRSILTAIRKLPYVRSIHLSTEVHTRLAPSSFGRQTVGLDQLRVPEAWDEYGSRGEGTTIAIIDTGIDYMHPALGGGFGEGFRVVGGYDFANNDDDPLDDNGHGTHVAGIAAGNGGSLLGVAPDATLYAYKVLGSNGSGSNEDIIAAIERAADPNEDGDFSDRVDVINLSLGTDGGASDSPESLAVDAVSELGVTVVAAAGNAGSYASVGSPASAATAIAVGAVNSLDELAVFSSRGPANSSFGIKPDVLAPGVDIESARPGGGNAVLSGTSMASPHVAGVAALVRAAHPDWEPARIASALMQTADRLDFEVMEQGSGRVDALKAIGSALVSIPASLSYGLSDLDESEWTSVQDLILSNDSDESVTLVFTPGTLPEGVALSASPATVTIAPGSTATSQVTVTVNHSQVPFPENGSFSITGQASFEGGDTALSLPWAFAKGIQLRIESDVVAPFFVLNSKAYGGSYTVGSPIVRPTDENPFVLEMLVPRGTYDLFMNVTDNTDENRIPHFVMRRGLELDAPTELIISNEEAIHTVSMGGLDENGIPLSSSGLIGPSTYGFRFPGDGNLPVFVNIQFLSTTFEEFRISDFGGGIMYPVEYQVDLDVSSTVRMIVHEIEEITGDTELVNAPGDLTVGQLFVNAPVDGNWDLRFEPVLRLISNEGEIVNLPQVNGVAFQTLSDPVWQGRIVTTADVFETQTYSVALVSGTRIDDVEEVRMVSAPFAQWEDRIVSSHTFSPASALFFPGDEGIMDFGATPIHPEVTFDNNRSGQAGIHFLGIPEIRGALEEVWLQSQKHLTWTIANETGQTLDEGRLENFGGYSPGPGRHQFDIQDWSYRIAGGQGIARLRSIFDLSSNDPNPPQITSFQIIGEDDRLTNRLSDGESAILKFSARDYEVKIPPSGRRQTTYVPVSDVQVHFREHRSQEWTVLNISLLDEEPGYGKVYSTSLAPAMAMNNTAMDLRFTATDAAGNTAEWSLEPAFVVGDFEFPVASEEFPGDESQPLKFELGTAYPNPFNPTATIRFELPRSMDVRLTVYDLLGRRVATLVDDFRTTGAHTVTFEARNLASGMYVYRLEADGQPLKQRTMMLVK